MAVTPAAREEPPASGRTPVRASEPELGAVRALAAFLDRVDAKGAADRPSLLGPNDERVPLPDSVVRLLRDAVEHLSRGEGVSVVRVDEELTTQQAADLLNVSRPYLIRLLERENIPHRRVGTHRRIRRDVLLRYREQRDRQRRAALRDLTRDSEDLGLYNDEPQLAPA